MQLFDRLVEVADQLLGPEGCPWDKKQTFTSLQMYLLEETHEVLEAVACNNMQELVEELGDVLFIVLFYAKIAEKQGKFSLQDVIKKIIEKMADRHPHVFGGAKAETIEDVFLHWNKAKSLEKRERKSALEGIPKTLPSLALAQKIQKRASEAGFNHQSKEKTFASRLWNLVQEGESQGIDLETQLRLFTQKYKERFQAWERAKAPATRSSGEGS